MADYALRVSDDEIARYRMMAQRARATEADLWVKAGIVSGAVVADVGCGPAAVSVVMADVVGPSGRVIGVERDESALTAARQLVDQAGASNVELRQGLATSTGLEAGSVDVAVMRHVLAHNCAEEEAIVAHLATLVRPGGCVYLVDIDATAFRMIDLDPDLADLHGKYLEFHKSKGNDLQPGLRLGNLLRAAGLELLEHTGRYDVMAAPPGMRPPPWAAREAMLEAGIVTGDDISRWEQAFGRSDRQEQPPTVFVTGFAGIGRKRS